MSKRIKGITIELNGETKGLDKALGSVNKRSNQLQGELKDVERLLKFNPGNTELLAQKQKILSEQVAATGDKLNQLKAAQQQVNQAFAAGDINESQYRAFQRELTETEGRLQAFERKLDSTDQAIRDSGKTVKDSARDWSAAGEKISEAGDKMKGAGAAMSQGVTGPIVGLGAAALKSASDFDASQGNIQSSLGTTAEEAERLNDVAKNVWREGFGESLKGVTDDLALIRQNMGDMSDQELQQMLEGTTLLRDKGWAEVSESTRTASVLMKNFGIDSKTALDLMTTGFQRGGNFSDELMDTMREYAPQFKGMGYDAEEFTAILIAGAEAGAFNLDKIGDAAKESFVKIGDGTKGTRDALGGLGLDVNQIENDINAGGESANAAFAAVAAVASAIAGVEKPADRAQAAIALFGAPMEDLGPEFQTFFANVNTDLGDFEGATQRASDAMRDNFGTRLTSVIRELQVALLPLGMVLLEMAEAILPQLEAMIQRVAGWFANLSPAGQQLTVILGLVAAAIGPLLYVLGMIAGAIGNLIPVFAKLFTYLKYVRTAFTVIRTILLALTGPIGLAIAVITLLAVAIYQNWDAIKAKTIEVFDYLKTKIPEVWTAIKSWVSQVVTSMVTYVVERFTTLRQVAIMIFESMKTMIPAIWSTLRESMSRIVQQIVTYVVGRFTAFKLAVTTIFTGIKTVIQTILSAIGGVIRTIWNGYMSYIRTVLTAIRTIVSTIFTGIKTVIGRTLDGARRLAMAVFTALRDGIVQRVENIRSRVKGAFDKVREAITGPVEKAKDAVLRIIEIIKSAFEKLSIKIPKPKLPKVSVTKGSKNIGGVDIPFPQFDVKWFKKGGVFGSASVIGVGEEPGVSEAVVPLKPSVLAQIGKGIADNMPGATGGNGEVSIYLDGYLIAKAMQPHMDRGMQARAEMKSYSKGVR